MLRRGFRRLGDAQCLLLRGCKLPRHSGSRRSSPIAENLHEDCLLLPLSKTGINGIAVGARTVAEAASAGAESAAIAREFDLSGVEDGSQVRAWY